MLISYFEEFPTKRNLSKLGGVGNCNLFVATKSNSELQRIKKNCSEYSVTVVNWPTLSKKKGYWFSPFMDSSVLQQALSKMDKGTMLDLEFPYYRWHILKHLFSFLENKRLIQKTINKHNLYFSVYGHLPLWLLRSLGLMYNGNAIIMCYRSRMPLFGRTWFKHKVRQAAKLGLRVGVGLTAPGVHGNERTYSKQELGWDLDFCRENGIKEVVVFRLGGI